MKRPTAHSLQQHDPKGFEIAQPLFSTASRQEFALTLGHLRPRFTSEGALHEFQSIAKRLPVGDGNDRREFEEQLVATLLPSQPGAPLPEGFFLARSLVWPLVDPLGTPALIIQPRMNYQILQLLENLRASFREPKGQAWTLVHSVLLGSRAAYGGELHGLPLVDLVEAQSYTLDDVPRNGCGSPTSREFELLLPLLANNGAGDRWRAINLTLLRSAALYKALSDFRSQNECSPQRGWELTGLQTRAAGNSPDFPLMDVVFTFEGVDSGATRRLFERVNLRGPFPFLSGEHLLPFYSASILSE